MYMYTCTSSKLLTEVSANTVDHRLYNLVHMLLVLKSLIITQCTTLIHVFAHIMHCLHIDITLKQAILFKSTLILKLIPINFNIKVLLTPGLRKTRGNFGEYKTFIIPSLRLIPKLITLPNRPSYMQPYCRVGT